MAKLAYCTICKATYPLNIVVTDGGRSGKTKEPTCPMGHTEVEGSTRHGRGVARSRRGLGLSLILAAVVLAADQAIKLLVRREAAHLPLRIAHGVRIEFNRNSGISFSQLSNAGDLVIVLVTLVCAGVAVALWFVPSRYKPALGIILGGAVGNLVDRLAWNGAVIDFLGIYRWPTFNLADVAIVVGTAMLVLQVLRGAAD